MKRLLIFYLIFGFCLSMTMEKPKKNLKRSFESGTELESENESYETSKKKGKQSPLIQLLVNASDSDALVKNILGVFIVGKSLDYRHEISLIEPVTVSVLSKVYKIEFNNNKVLVSRFKNNPNIFEKIAEIPAQDQKQFKVEIFGKTTDVNRRNPDYNPIKVTLITPEIE